MSSSRVRQQASTRHSPFPLRAGGNRYRRWARGRCRTEWLGKLAPDAALAVLDAHLATIVQELT